MPCWSLIGRVGNGPIFPVGTSLQNFTAPSAGELYLGVNDTPNDYFDNTGEWQAEITTSVPCVPPLAHDISCLKLYEQKQSLWCWAAAAEILMENSGAGWEHHDQCEQVAVLKNLPAATVCGANGDAGFHDQAPFTPWNTGATPQASFDAFHFTYSMGGSSVNFGLGGWLGVTTVQALVSQIGCGNRPIGIVWTNDRDLHNMVVTGYETNPLAGGLVLHIYNPGIHPDSGPAPSPANAAPNSAAKPGVVCMYSQTCRISYTDFLNPDPFRLISVIYDVHKAP